jgi:erythromycin esterase-like protein
MATSSNADVSELRETFRGARGEAAELLDELLESREIYRAFFEHRNYESNSQRSELMRRHFAAYLARARSAGEGQPKAVVKLGANHVFRGPSTTDTYEIGAFAHELALASGSHAFGMLVVVAKGTLNAYRPFGSVEADKHKSFDARDAFSFTDLTPFLSAASTKSYTLFDLRPILAAVHDGRTAPVRPKVLRLLQSFDALIVIPEGHASTLIE